MENFDSEDGSSSIAIREQRKTIREQTMSLVAGLLRADLRYLLPWGIFMALPSMWLTLQNHFVSQEVLFSLSIAGRFLTLFFSFWIISRWLRKIGAEIRITPQSTLMFFLFGIGIWLLFSLNLLVTLLDFGDGILLATAFGVGVALTIWLRFILYPVPLLCGNGSFKTRLDQASSMRRGEPFLALKLLLPVAGFYLVASGIPQIVAPDGTLLIPSLLIDLAGGLTALLPSYLILAATLTRASPEDLRAFGLDPYHRVRLTELRKSGGRWLKTQLQLQQSILWVIVGTLLYSANMLRQAQLPPAAIVTVDAMKIRGSKLFLTLTAQDTKFALRGFAPGQFRLAGEKGVPVSQAPTRVTVAGADEELEARPALSTDPITLTLEFDTTRKGEDLKALQDLNLWYLYAKVLPLKMSDAVIEPVKQ